MRKAILALLALGLVGGVLMVKRYLDAESAARSVRDEVRNFSTLLVAALGDGPASTAAVREVVLGMASKSKGVTLAPDDIEVMSVPIEVGEGRTSCKLPSMPPEFKLLPTGDKGNVRNLAVRCRRDITLVGFRARARGPTGKRFKFAAWTYSRGFSG